ncbi:MAG: hypothetical protein ABH837_00790 [bacterium]
MKKNIWIYSIVIFLGLVAIILPKIFEVQAQDPINIYVRVEASLDNGATWHNFESTVNAGEETLTVSGGDIVLVRVKMWNESSDMQATGSIGDGILTNSDYISNAEIISLNEDGDGFEFDGYFWGNSGIATIDLIPGQTETVGYQSLSLNLTIAENIPADTTIEGRVTISDEGEEGEYITFNPFGESKAFADGLGRYSSFRLTTASAPSILPETGVNILK